MSLLMEAVVGGKNVEAVKSYAFMLQLFTGDVFRNFSKKAYFVLYVKEDKHIFSEKKCNCHF